MAKDKRNVEITNKVYQVLNEVKGFDVAMGDPHNGKVLARFGDDNFVITIEPAYHEEDKDRAPKDIHEFADNMKYILR